MASSLLASVLVAAGGAVGGPPGSAAPWASTLGEPLHDSSHQALELTQHLKAMGAKFYGAWTCPACFKQKNLFMASSLLASVLVAAGGASRSLQRRKDPGLSHLGSPRWAPKSGSSVPGSPEPLEWSELRWH